MPMDDNVSYYRFTGPQRLDKAVHTLEGLVKGIAADRRISEGELALIRSWLDEHRMFKDKHPFNEFVPLLEHALADGVLDDDELKDVLWLCNKFTTDDAYFCAVSSDMQRLQGMLGGIAADGSITKAELDGLRSWMEAHEHLRRCWPYDELEALILDVLKDGRIDTKEHGRLLTFFSDFTSSPGHRVLSFPLNEVDQPVMALCAVCPEVEFDECIFCFTGKSSRLSRKQLAKIVVELGGSFSPNVRKDVDYLVIGADGNPCWAYTCYGRKVEEAIQHRKDGLPLLLVHEYDFWDAVQDAG